MGIGRGDSNEITRNYFDRLLIETRLIESDLPSAKITLWGREFRTPVMGSAFSHIHHLCGNASVKMALGVKRAGALNWWGMCENDEFQEIAVANREVIRIIKPYKDEVKIFSQIESAIAEGALGVGMDIDHSFHKNGGYDNVMGEEMRPKTLEQIRSYVKAAGELPFVIKGVLSVTDAMKSAEAGAAGILVSHHHGIMEYAVPPLMVLPDIRRELGRDFPVFVDCGIESGTEAFKALALGATAVGVSRHILEVLKTAGEQGVADRFDRMTDELRAFMARTGARTVAEIDPAVIHFM